MMMRRSDRIFVAGHLGMVGRAVVRRLRSEGYDNLAVADKSDVNLLDQQQVSAFVAKGRFQHVIIAAARVGGIRYNIEHPATIGYENGQITLNLLQACHQAGVERVLFLGSSCIYPRECPQPMREEYLMTGPLEPTNELYALAKVFGIKLVEAYNRQFGHRWISCQPCNLYGPWDNFHPENSHFVAAFLRRFHEAVASRAETVECWGTGEARREVLHVDDLADIVVRLLELYSGPLINVGSGRDDRVRDIAEEAAKTVGFTGHIRWDASKPEGMPRKLLDVSRLNSMGWRPRYDLAAGLRHTYRWWRQHEADGTNHLPARVQLVG